MTVAASVASRVSASFQVTITRKSQQPIVKKVAALQEAVAYKQALRDLLEKKPPEATFQVQRVGVRGGFSSVTKADLTSASKQVTNEMVRAAKRELAYIHKH